MSLCMSPMLKDILPSEWLTCLANRVIKNKWEILHNTVPSIAWDTFAGHAASVRFLLNKSQWPSLELGASFNILDIVQD